MDAKDIDALVIDRPEDGIFKVHSDVYRSQEIFDLEMKHIFEGGWMFLGLACQAPEPHDFFTTHIGRQSVIVSRDGDGRLHGLINACRHRGSLVCHGASGNGKVHTCPYHGWSFDSAGRNVGITSREHGAYGPGFDDEDHDLLALPRFDEYRGFLFGSLSPDVPPLDDHLGQARVFIDLVVDQGADGIEIVPGTVNYTYMGNWKLQIENSADFYHFNSAHQTFLQIIKNRAAAQSTASPYRNRRESEVTRGTMCFPNGHNVLFGGGDNVKGRPLYLDLDKVRERVSEVRLKWMLYTRNVLFFPNMQLLENASLQIRVNRPVSVDRTKISTYCIGPKGESAEARERRIRQYEEFFNPSGLATSDDTSIFEFIQAGGEGDVVDWNQGYMRGMAEVNRAPVEAVAELGLTPDTAIVGHTGLGDETILHGPIREWRRRMIAALSGGAARPHGRHGVAAE